MWQLESESEFAGQRNSKLTFTFKDLIEVPTFLDYLRAGWTISFSTAIDYTSSNGLYTNPTSLHFISSQPNQYEQAIVSVGTVIEPYSQDKSFSVFVFGGIPKFLGNKSVNHCFPINGNY